MTAGSDETDRFDAPTMVGGKAAGTRSVTCAADQALSRTVPPPAAEGEAAAAPDPEARYDDEGEIGRGGMGVVRRVFDRVLMRPVAMKLIEPSLLGSEATNLFVEEAQITGQLDHPNIVPVHEFGMSPDRRAFFTMKLVSGRTLSQEIVALHKDGLSAADLERVLRMLLKVCEAVGFAHSRGVVHRDLKPANVMVGTHGQVYVMDWGLGMVASAAKAADGSGERASIRTSVKRRRTAGELVGTIAYMAPEQALGNTNAIDARTDVFALGAILYEVLTGRPPIQADSRQEGLLMAAAARITPPQDVSAKALPPGLCDIAMRAMRAEPDDRYPTVEALREELESVLRGGGWFATRRYKAGEMVVREGDPADAVLIVAEGRCEVFRERDGKRVRIREMGPGEVFGEAALLNAKPRSASVVALEDMMVKVVTPDAFERELSRSTWLGALVRQMTARLMDASVVKPR